MKENHKKDQLEFTKTHLNKQKYLRDNALWTDEIKLELFGKTQALYLQEKKNYSKKRSLATIKHGGV